LWRGWAKDCGNPQLPAGGRARSVGRWMGGNTESQPTGLTRYLVELERPSAGWGELQFVTARARAGAEQLAAEGAPVRFLRAIFVPEDQSCCFLYEAGSAEVVAEAGRRAQLAIQAVQESVRITESGGR
jgi:hypothetical protein